MQKSTDKSTSWQIKQAVNNLRAGKLVAFPTETVYGLGADASNVAAIAKVFKAKGRPQHNPLIVHIAGASQLKDWAVDIPPIATTLANHFWPGPLTIILAKQPHVSTIITGGQDTIALRIPKHSITLAMLQQFGSGIVGPSANTYGKISPTTASHILNDLGKKVDFILDGGECELGIESTIVSCIDDHPCILRQGSITAADIANAVGYPVSNNNGTSPITVPGQQKSHYAPNKPLFLVKKKELFAIIKLLAEQNQPYAILSFSAPTINIKNLQWQQMPADPKQYAAMLYATLHALDTTNKNITGILVEAPPSTITWAAITDRLTRASKEMLSLEQLSAEEI